MIVTRKQYTVYAVQWNGINFDEIKEYMQTRLIGHDKSRNGLIISTSKGDEIVHVTDWIIKDINTSIQIVVVDNETFNANYEQVKE